MPALLPVSEAVTTPPPRVDEPAQRSAAGISADEFQALEQKVLRAVEIVRREREARAAAEAESDAARAESAAARTESAAARTETAAFKADAAAAKDQVSALHEQLEAAERSAALAREQAADAERQAADLNERISTLTLELEAAQSSAQTQVNNLHQERDAVRLRVEKMLEQMDALL